MKNRKYYIRILGIWWRIPKKLAFSKFASNFYVKMSGRGFKQ